MKTLKVLKVLKHPDDRLRRVATPVNEFNEDLRIKVREMWNTLDSISDAVGLASIQVGIEEQIIVIDYNCERIVIINPKIIEEEGQASSSEGCLSVPFVSANVSRATKILVRYSNEDGQEIEEEFSGRLATIVQHEMEHLNGGLMFDTLSSSKRKKVLGEYKRKVKTYG